MGSDTRALSHTKDVTEDIIKSEPHRSEGLLILFSGNISLCSRSKEVPKELMMLEYVNIRWRASYRPNVRDSNGVLDKFLCLMSMMVEGNN